MPPHALALHDRRDDVPVRELVAAALRKDGDSLSADAYLPRLDRVDRCPVRRRTRIPALLLSARMKRSGVDHTSYDTTSIIATLERSFRLEPVGIRDSKVADLRRALRLGGHRH